MFHDRNHAMPNRSFFLLPLIQLSLLFSPFRAMVAKAHHRMAQALYYMCSFSLGNFTYLYRYLVGNRPTEKFLEMQLSVHAKTQNLISGVARWISIVAATPAATRTSPTRIRISSSRGTSGEFITVHFICTASPVTL